MDKSEVKPSFSWGYFVLTFATALIVSGVGFFINLLNEEKTIKELEVYESHLISINEVQMLNAGINAAYYTSETPKKISTLFIISVTIKNIGNEGVEGLPVIFSLKEKEAILTKKPRIKTSPKDIFPALNISLDEKLSSSRKHTWNVPLLNPAESISFEYIVYSEDKIKSITLLVTPRKKNWKVVRSESKPDSDRTDPFLFFIAGIAIFFIALMLGLAAVWGKPLA